MSMTPTRALFAVATADVLPIAGFALRVVGFALRLVDLALRVVGFAGFRFADDKGFRGNLGLGKHLPQHDGRAT